MRTKRASQTKQKVFFSIFKWLSITTSCVRPESAPLTLTKVDSLQQRILIFSKPIFQNTYKQLQFCNASVALIYQKKWKKKILLSLWRYLVLRTLTYFDVFLKLCNSKLSIMYACADCNFSDYMMFCVWVWNIKGDVHILRLWFK